MLSLYKIILCCFLTLAFGGQSIAEGKQNIERIAHAGGGINNMTYTNSLEALNHNFRQGFKLFEIDFSWTSDKQLVCIHDWSASLKKKIGLENDNHVPSFDEFIKNKNGISKYTLLSLDDLSVWMDGHLSAKIVTDVKENNLGALKIIAKKIDNFANRVIPQIYNPSEYQPVKEIGYNNIIFTLYRMKNDDHFILKQVKNMDLFAVTMPIFRASGGLGIKLGQQGIPSYVHTINSIKKLKYFQDKLGIDEVYTDFLAPDEENNDAKYDQSHSEISE